MEVLVKDFNCIRAVKMDFQPGFNVIQGPSNSGKSSVIKAVEKCIFNQSGSTNVRHGADNLLVGIRYKGREVYLTKGKNTKYRVDNEIFEKIGVSQLEQVAAALNIREVVLGGEKVRLNFSNQFSYPFLLDKTPGQLYKFIVDSAESESLSDVLKDMAKDIKDLDKAIIQNEAQIDILNRQKVDIESKLLNADEILKVSNDIIDLDVENNKMDAIQQSRERYLRNKADVVFLKNSLSAMRIDFDTSLLDESKDTYMCYRDVTNRYHSCKAARDGLVGKVKDLTLNVDMQSIDDEAAAYQKVLNLYKRFKDLYSVKQNLVGILKESDIKIQEAKEVLNSFGVCPLCGKKLENCGD